MGRAFEFRKARKMKRWSAMSKAFTRIGKDIVMAVKEGGPDPDSNSRLRAVIQNAKSVNMPKDNVERAIKRASDKSQGDYKEVIFEGYAQHGIAVLIETATDNNTRTVANVRAAFNKTDGNLGTSGSVVFMFDHTCNFKIKGDNLDLEELELELIDFGVEEIFEDTDENEQGETQKVIMIYAPFESFGNIQGYLEANNIGIISSGFERIPQVTKKLTPEQQEDVEKLLEKLDDDDDVQNVYANLEINNNFLDESLKT
ncbi:MAG TPA: YebC/PmpR family DNA-binding transcriptional regulator [Flavobacteriaceae bacterium]|nr:YebC/PmpR family DNA-binding transcriptional regulator [Flavobacteriaceae bacterium]